MIRAVFVEAWNDKKTETLQICSSNFQNFKQNGSCKQEKYKIFGYNQVSGKVEEVLHCTELIMDSIDIEVLVVKCWSRWYFALSFVATSEEERYGL